MEKNPVGNYSMVFKWKTAVPHPERLPILLMAHMDVVPAGDGNWTYPPFSGHITDTEIWGRGAIDDKQMLLGNLVAITHLMEAGFKPNRDIYVTFGFDEEISGFKGACAVSEYLRSQKLKFEFIHDEGMPVLQDVVPGVSVPAVPVGLAEKGSLDMEVTLAGSAGHSSIPPSSSIIGLLSRGVAELEANPMPSHFESISRMLMERLAPDMDSPALKTVFSNLWFFKPLVRKILEGKPSTNAIVRTTTAVTIIRGGNKRNVLPSSARVHLNFRISPLDTVQQVLDHVKKVFLSVDPRFAFEVLDSLEPAPISDPDSQTFKDFSSAIRSTFPEVLVTPGVMVGNTDTRHFWGLSDNIYRFAPNILTQEGVDTFHNVNERISKKNLDYVINFYHQLLLKFATGK